MKYENAKIKQTEISEIKRRAKIALKKSQLETATEKTPIQWLARFTAFKPFDYQIELLENFNVRNRVVRKGRQVGATRAFGAEALAIGAINPNETIIFISPSLRQSVETLTKGCQQTLGETPELFDKFVESSQKTMIQFYNGSRIISLPNKPETIRTYTATRIYLDEAAHFANDRDIWAAIRPMLITTKGPLTQVSTPFGKRGMFFDSYELAVEKDKSPDYLFLDWYPSTISPLISEADIEHERENMTDEEIRQEYYGEFIEEVDTWLSKDLILSCVDVNLEPIVKIDNNGLPKENAPPEFAGIGGMDFAKQRDESVVQITEWVDDVLTQRYQKAWGRQNYEHQLGELKIINKKLPITALLLDQSNVGERLIEEIQEFIESVEGTKFTLEDKNDMMVGLKLLFEQKRIKIFDDPKLIRQLNSIRYEISKSGKRLFTSPEKATLHDDYAWALAMSARMARDAGALFAGWGKKIV